MIFGKKRQLSMIERKFIRVSRKHHDIFKLAFINDIYVSHSQMLFTRLVFLLPKIRSDLEQCYGVVAEFTS